ncbi:MAG: RNA polymerase sigma factor [Spirochaetales bacterium]|nr:RNA polymerase sigma factor [Spirochaetales bacterium]
MNVESSSKLSFEIIYESLFSVIYRVAYRIVGDSAMAEDMTHDAFIKLYQRNEALPDLNQTKYWLIRVVKNMSFNYSKRKQRERRAYDKFKDRVPVFEESGEDVVLKKESKNLVKDALEQLPHNLRVVLILKEYAGMNYREIGETLGISEGNVKVRVFRAREKLSQIMKEVM